MTPDRLTLVSLSPENTKVTPFGKRINFMKRALPIFIVLAFSGCAILFPDRTAPKSSAYKVTPPATPWTKLAVTKDPETIETMRADLAYENPDSGAIISLNSLCRKYANASLEILTDNLVRGISGKKLKDRKSLTVDQAEAMDSVFLGQLDGVDLQIRTVVLKKDGCTYDFIHISTLKRMDQTDTFDQFLASFRTDQ